MIASFLTAGLVNHELCVWILPSPVTRESALHELAARRERASTANHAAAPDLLGPRLLFFLQPI